MKKMDVGCQKWLMRTARAQFWRVAPWYEVDDLIHDGFLCWQICAAKYKRANRRHLMSLFKTTFLNHIHRLANRRTSAGPELALDELPDILFCQDGEMQALISEAPTPLRQCLQRIMANPELLARPMRKGRRLQSTSEWLRDITGIQGDADLAAQLRDLLRAS